MATIYREIEHLIYCASDAFDRGDFAAVGALFEHGSIEFLPSRWRLSGQGEITNYYQRGIIIYSETATPQTMHQISNVIIDVDAVSGEVRARSRFIVYQWLPDQAMQIICSGRYYDRFVTVEQVWHFRERRIEAEFFGDLSRHIVGWAEMAQHCNATDSAFA